MKVQEISAQARWIHISNRGARQLPIYGDESDCRSFLSLVREASDKTSAEFHAFALMPNHFHLLAYASPTDSAAAMKLIGSVYTRNFNRRYGYDGPLLKARYWRSPICDERHLLATLAYIHNNPLAATGDHEMLHTYRWTSHALYLGADDGASWLHRRRLLDMVGGTQSYRRLLTSCSSPSVDAGLPKAMRVRLSAFADIERAVGIDSESERAAVRSGGRGIRTHQRLAAIVLATDHADELPEQIARRFGYSSSAGLRSAVSRARRLASDNTQFEILLGNARSRLLQ